ncbi:NUDIX domain-containing protein [Streptomyces sp. NPDC056529]|uniref:NUDIX domain-containing protein n=1 Tax=Streptomyces sp. NPDC056529 TaxID=3345855 RepID=UPI00368B8515
MTTASASDETPSVSIADEDYGALRAAAAVWAGASVLITDRRGRVLIERVGYRDTCLLPGGAVDKGESPAHAAVRELLEELGITMSLDRGLAVDWVSAAGVEARPALRFPGEVLRVFDGGTWGAEQIAAIRPRPGEIEAVEFVEPARLPELMSPDNARRALSALRARVNAAGSALLEDGLPITPTVLDRSRDGVRAGGAAGAAVTPVRRAAARDATGTVLPGPGHIGRPGGLYSRDRSAAGPVHGPRAERSGSPRTLCPIFAGLAACWPGSTGDHSITKDPTSRILVGSCRSVPYRALSSAGCCE